MRVVNTSPDATTAISPAQPMTNASQRGCLTRTMPAMATQAPTASCQMRVEVVKNASAGECAVSRIAQAKEGAATATSATPRIGLGRAPSALATSPAMITSNGQNR